MGEHGAAPPERLLTSVRVVTSHALPLELALLVDTFVDCSGLWSLESATDAGLVHLLRRLAPREWPGVGPTFRKLRYDSAVRSAVENGHLSVLQWWLEHYGDFQPPAFRLILTISIARGHVHILQWLKARDALLPAASSIKGMLCTHPSAVYWLHDLRDVFSLSINVVNAAKDGDLTFLRWMHEHEAQYANVSGWDLVIYRAALARRWEILRWVQAHRPADFTDLALLGAIEGKHVDVAQWLASCGLELQAKMPWVSNLDGMDLPMAQWLVLQLQGASMDKRHQWIDPALSSAIRAGDLEAAQVLYDHRTLDPQGLVSMSQAAQGGHLHIVQWLHAQGALCRPQTMDVAAGNGHLEVVQWLQLKYADECSAAAITKAASNGHLAMVQWLHEHQAARLNADVMYRAAYFGHLPIVQYVQQQGDRADWWTGNEMQTAARNGHLSVVSWLHENGMPGPVNVDLVACNGHLAVLQFLFQQCGCRCSATGAILAARARRFALLEWLMQQDPELVDPSVLAS